MLRYTEFDRQKVRDLLDEHAAEVKRSERILGHPDEALAKNNQEIERLRKIMSDSERAIFDELIDSELQIDQQKARENLIISRHEHRQIETEFKVMQEQETRERKWSEDHCVFRLNRSRGSNFVIPFSIASNQTTNPLWRVF